jgi:hypothetical protein
MNTLNVKFEGYQDLFAVLNSSEKMQIKDEKNSAEYDEINKIFKYSADDHIVLTTYGGGPSNVLDDYVSYLINKKRTFKDNTTTIRSNDDNRQRIYTALFKKRHDEIVWKNMLAGVFEVFKDKNTGKFKDNAHTISLENEQDEVNKNGTNLLDKLKSSQTNTLKITINGHGNGYKIGEFDNQIIKQIDITLSEKAKMGNKLRVLYISFHSCNSALFLERYKKTIIDIAELCGIEKLKLKAFNGYLEKNFYNQKTNCFYVWEKYDEENERLFNKLNDNILITNIDKPDLGKGKPVYSINAKKNYSSYFFYNKASSNVSLEKTEQRFIGIENKII